MAASDPGGGKPSEGFCEDCATGFSWAGDPAGKEGKLGAVDVYETLPENPASASAAVLVLHDAFGWKFKNSRIMCDRLANELSLPVYMPDLFEGDSMGDPDTLIRDLFNPPPTMLGRVFQNIHFAVSVPSLLMFVRRHGPAMTDPILDAALSEIKGKHGGDGCKIGAVGYCWGGRYTLRYGAKGELAAAVACHPSAVSVGEDNLKEMKAPALFLQAEHDMAFTPRLWQATEEAVKASGATYESCSFEGTKHGFAVRCNEADESEVKAKDEAFAKTVGWFKRFLL